VPGATVCLADCYIFWEKKDNGLRAFFINQISAPRKKTAPGDRYHQIQQLSARKNAGKRKSAIISVKSRNGIAAESANICAGTPKWLAGINQNASRKSLPVQNPNRLLEAT